MAESDVSGVPALSQSLQNLSLSTSTLQELELEEAEDYLAFIQRNIARWRAKEQEAKKVIEERRQLLKKPSVAVEKLSDDILFHIFLLLVHSEFKPLPMITSRLLQYPWALAATCRRWRDVCLDRATLWSYFILSPTPSHTCPNTSVTTPLLSTYLQLERSKNTPLFVDAACMCDCPSQLAIFRAIISQSHRFRELYFPLDHTDRESEDQIPQLAVSSQGIIPPDSDFPLLRHLSWYRPSYEDESAPQMPFTPSVCSTLVEVCHASLQELSHLDMECNFPWTQLVTLTLINYNGTASSVLSLLPSLINLTQFTIRFDGQEGEEDIINIQHDSIVLPVMSVLQVGRDPLGVMKEENFFPYFRTPALRFLTYGDCSDDTILDFVTRSSCSIINLHILQSYNPAQLSILRSQANLETLAIGTMEEHDGPCCDDLLRDLVYRKAPRTFLCPSLFDLRLDGQKFDPTSLINFIDSRFNNDSKVTPLLETLDIGYLVKSPEEIDGYKLLYEERFKSYQSTGSFKFTLRHELM